MHRTNKRTGSKLTTAMLGFLAAIVVISIVLFPDQAFQASLEGLTVWWKLVFPALMPFFILTELLTGFGVIHAVGTLLTPLMRLLFRLPGVSGWALASGLIVGFPAGAKITANLRETGQLTRSEAERLNALSHVCSPLFLLTVVGVGFLHSAALGVLLAVVHYLSAIVIGLLFRNQRPGRKISETEMPRSDAAEAHPAARAVQAAKGSIWRQSSISMREAYLHDGRSFGKLLGDSVTSSVQSLMLIGGYMMIFSVIIHVVSIAHILDVIRVVSDAAMSLAGIHTDLAPQWTKGLFEVHLGAYAFSQTQVLPLMWQMALLGAVLAWGGLSAHAQAAGFHHKTDVRYLPFLLARALHALTAFALTILLWKPLQTLLVTAEPSFLRTDAEPASPLAPAFSLEDGHLWFVWTALFSQLIVLVGVMVLFSLLANLFRSKNTR